MKTIYRFLFLMLTMVAMYSCMDELFVEGNPDFILSFSRDGRTTAAAGTTFYVIPTGTSEFLTLYNGTQGHVWGEEGATGIDLNQSDSIAITFDTIGTYQVSLVATSVGDYGNKIVKKAKTIEVNVVDERNSIESFYMNDEAGEIKSDGRILFSFPDVTTSLTFAPFFNLSSNSKACKITVDGVEQVSGETEHTFTPDIPVVYTVKSPEGVEKIYSVIVSLYNSSTSCALTKFNLASGVTSNGFGEVGVIDDVNKMVSITANYASKIDNILVVLEASYASTQKIGTRTYSNRRYFALTNNSIITITAQDKKTISTYGLNITVQDPITDFTFEGFTPSPVRTIDNINKTITIDVAKGTDISALKAKWTGSKGVVTVLNGTTEIVQTNGQTINDFRTPVKYVFYKGNNSTTDVSQLQKGDEYTINVNLK